MTSAQLHTVPPDAALARDWRTLPMALVGAGAAGSALAHAWRDAGGTIAAIASRSAEQARSLAQTIGTRALSDVAAVDEASIVVLAVPDGAIASAAAKLSWRRGQIAVHLSGALGPEALKAVEQAGAHAVAFHPLCAFARGGQARLPKNTHFGYTGPAAFESLFAEIARDLGGELLTLPPEGRVLYHAAAVLASNDLVALVAGAVAVLERAGVAREAALPALLPLLRSTIDNLASAGLPRALTGPVVRGDLDTVRRHQAALADTPEGALYDALLRATARLALQRDDVPADARPALTALAQGSE